MIEACPVCDSANFEINSNGGYQGPKDQTSKHYRCRDCGKLFDESVTREVIGNRDTGRSGMTKKLVDANPEDWP